MWAWLSKKWLWLKWVFANRPDGRLPDNPALGAAVREVAEGAELIDDELKEKVAEIQHEKYDLHAIETKDERTKDEKSNPPVVLPGTPGPDGV
jgi:hypothetical protein